MHMVFVWYVLMRSEVYTSAMIGALVGQKTGSMVIIFCIV